MSSFSCLVSVYFAFAQYLFVLTPHNARSGNRTHTDEGASESNWKMKSFKLWRGLGV